MIHFNDQKEGCHDYIRNKYGSIDRSYSSKRRMGGLELTHLGSLKHLSSLGQIDMSAKIDKPLENDFVTIKKKIEFIIEDSINEEISKNSKEISAAFEILGETKNLSNFVKYYYSKMLMNEMLVILDDKNLGHLIFTNRNDRYYFGISLLMLGELSKDLMNLMNLGKEGELFTFFKKIRDRNLAHSSSALVRDIELSINQIQINHFKFLLNTLMQEELRSRIESIKSYLENPFDLDKEYTLDFSTAISWPRQQLKKLRESIFKKQIDTLNTEEILEKIKNNKVEVENIKTQINKKSEQSRKKINPKSQHNDPYIIISKIRTNIYKYQSSKGLNDKFSKNIGLPQLAEKCRKEILLLVERFNKNPNVDEDSRLPDNIDTLTVILVEQIAIKMERVEKSNMKLANQENENIDAKIEDSQKEYKKSTAIQKSNDEIINKKIKKKDIDLKVVKKKIKKYSCIISKEFDYMLEVLKADTLEQKKKIYVVIFSFTKIGQLFKDIENLAELPELADLIHYDYVQSVRATIMTRNKLVHDILSSKNVPISYILFRQTLPLVNEIKALIEILKLGPDSDQMDLGQAYLELRQYNKAIEIFTGIIHSYPSKVLQFESDPIELIKAYFNRARAYELYGNEERSKGNKELASDLYKKELFCIQSPIVYFETIQGFAPDLGLFEQSLVNAYKRSGNACSRLGNFDEAIIFHEKALLTLGKTTEGNIQNKAICLVDIGTVYTFEAIRNLRIDSSNQNKQKIIDQNRYQAIKLLLEAKELLEEHQNTKNITYYQAMQYLALVLSMSNEAQEVIISKSLNEQLINLMKDYAARPNSPEILSVNDLSKFLSGRLQGIVNTNEVNVFNRSEVNMYLTNLTQTFLSNIRVNQGSTIQVSNNPPTSTKVNREEVIDQQKCVKNLIDEYNESIMKALNNPKEQWSFKIKINTDAISFKGFLVQMLNCKPEDIKVTSGVSRQSPLHIALQTKDAVDAMNSLRARNKGESSRSI